MAGPRSAIGRAPDSYVRGPGVRQHTFVSPSGFSRRAVVSYWLVGCLVGFGFNGPLRQYFSLYRAASQREEERVRKG